MPGRSDYLEPYRKSIFHQILLCNDLRVVLMTENSQDVGYKVSVFASGIPILATLQDMAIHLLGMSGACRGDEVAEPMGVI